MCEAVPGALDHLVLGTNVQELAIIFGALTLCKEVAQRHALHIILVQILAHIALLALAPQPVLAHVRPLDTLVPHGALVPSFAGALCMPGSTQ